MSTASLRSAGILAAFFLSVPSPTATKPNVLINLAYVGAISLTFGLIVLGAGLLLKGS